MKLRSAALVAATAALVAVGSVPAAEEPPAAAASSPPTIPLLTVGDTLPLTTLDISKLTPVCDAYGALEGLLTVGTEGQPVPLLAQSWSTPNPTTYVFHLRHNVDFWDGDSMTSADVVNALNYYRRPTSLVASGYRSVTSVKAAGPYTVIVTLARPDASFLPALSWESNIFEKKFQEIHGATMGNPGVLTMGTGPFEVDSLDPTTGMELSANPHWWGGTVPIGHVSLKFFSTETSEALAFRAGEIDVAFPSPSVPFASASGAKLVSSPANDDGYFAMNVHQAPWDNIHVRRAVAYALNRSDIIEALGNTAVPVTTFIPPFELRTIGSQGTVSALVNSVPSYPYNVAKAKAELAQSPYPNGFSATIETPTFGAYVPVTEVMAAELARIGIKLVMKTMTFNQFLAFGTGPKTFGDVYVDFNLVNSDPSSFPAYLLGSWNIKPGEWNLANYGAPAVDTLINEGLSAQNPAQRLAIYGKMLTILATDEPYVPLYVQDYNLALSRKYKTTAGFSIAYSRLFPWELDVAPRS